MNIYKEINFTSKGDNYRVLTFLEVNGYKISIVKNGQSLPWTYSVDFNFADDFLRTIGERAVDHLIKLAEADIYEKRFKAVIVPSYNQKRTTMP